jgi:alcohol dehydrogenase
MMNELFGRAQKLLSSWKGEKYIFGRGVLQEIGRVAATLGKNALVVCNTTYIKPAADAAAASLQKAGVSLAGGTIVPGAGPNAPRADVFRIETYILHHKPDMIIALGGRFHH